MKFYLATASTMLKRIVIIASSNTLQGIRDIRSYWKSKPEYLGIELIILQNIKGGKA